MAISKLLSRCKMIVKKSLDANFILVILVVFDNKKDIFIIKLKFGLSDKTHWCLVHVQVLGREFFLKTTLSFVILKENSSQVSPFSCCVSRLLKSLLVDM